MEVRAHRARAPVLYMGNNGGVQLEAPERRQAQLPSRGGALHALRFRRKMDDGLARYVVQTAIMKHNGVTADYRLVVTAKRLARHPPHLKHVHEVGLIGHLNYKFQFVKIEVLK